MSLTLLLDNTDGYITGQNPKVLVTMGLGPCAGIAVYDPRSKTGVLGHFAAPRESQNFKGMMDWISANLKPGNLEVTLTGISLDTPEITPEFNEGVELALNASNSYRLGKRQQLVSAFEGIGVKPRNIKQKFSGPDMVTDLALYTHNGEVVINQEGRKQLFNCYNSGE